MTYVSTGSEKILTVNAWTQWWDRWLGNFDFSSDWSVSLGGEARPISAFITADTIFTTGVVAAVPMTIGWIKMLFVLASLYLFSNHPSFRILADLRYCRAIEVLAIDAWIHRSDDIVCSRAGLDDWSGLSFDRLNGSSRICSDCWCRWEPPSIWSQNLSKDCGDILPSFDCCCDGSVSLRGDALLESAVVSANLHQCQHSVSKI